VRWLDGSDARATADAAALHMALLGHSPVALLGPAFLSEFYYRSLPRDGLITGVIAYVDGKPAGLLVATNDSDGFLSRGLRRHWLRIGWILLRTVVLRPSRWPALWEALQIMGHRTAEAEAGTGELLSFGVLPEFRQLGGARKSSQSVAVILFERVLAQLERSGVERVRSLVDKDNRIAKIFYGGLGWQVRATDVPGWRTPQMEFIWTFRERGRSVDAAQDERSKSGAS
jgi:ribosomal protein S18 acetylase RimI-like enzyme